MSKEILRIKMKSIEIGLSEVKSVALIPVAGLRKPKIEL